MVWAMASPAMGHWGTCPPRLPTISFLVHFGVNLTANYPSMQLVQISTTHSSFDQYCISHKTISHRAVCCTRSWSPPWVLHDIISSFAPPRNKSWQRHWPLAMNLHASCRLLLKFWTKTATLRFWAPSGSLEKTYTADHRLIGKP